MRDFRFSLWQTQQRLAFWDIAPYNPIENLFVGLLNGDLSTTSQEWPIGPALKAVF
jgi:hypothetical protein